LKLLLPLILALGSCGPIVVPPFPQPSPPPPIVEPTPLPTPIPTPVPSPTPEPEPTPVPTPEPTPTPPPPTGPAPLLLRVDTYAHIRVDGSGAVQPIGPAEKWNVKVQRGGWVILDSTQKFQLPDGTVTACNADRATVCGCPAGNPTCREDARGNVWSLQGNCASEDFEVDGPADSSWQIKVRGTRACSATFSARPRADFPGPIVQGGTRSGRSVVVTVR